MTDDEARVLAQRIIDTWPGGPKAYIWRQLLRPLDATLAAAAYRILEAETDKATTAQFSQVYRRAQSSLAVRHPDPEGCAECDGHGWLTVVEDRFGHEYPAALPCTCPAGVAHLDAHRRIVIHNDHELDRLSAQRTRPSQHLRAEFPAPPADNGPTMTLVAYLDRQSDRVAAGDLDAVDNLAEWALAIKRWPTLLGGPDPLEELG